jgi:hypothetical protein
MDWNTFVQQAKEVALMAFLERINNRNVSPKTKNNVQQKQGIKKKTWGDICIASFINRNKSTENCYYVNTLTTAKFFTKLPSGGNFFTPSDEKK